MKRGKKALDVYTLNEMIINLEVFGALMYGSILYEKNGDFVVTTHIY